MTDRETAERIILEATEERDGKRRLACTQAFKLSREHEIPLKVIAEICEELGIKISACQLGCFR